MNGLRTSGLRVMTVSKSIGCFHDRLRRLRTSEAASLDGSEAIGRSQDGLSWLRTSGPGDRDAGAAIEGALIARRGAQERRH